MSDPRDVDALHRERTARRQVDASDLEEIDPVVPDIDLSLDEQPTKTRFWNAFKPVGPWWAELPPY